MVQAICAFLAAALGTGLIVGLSAADNELPKPGILMLALIFAGTGAVCFGCLHFHSEACPWYVGLICAYCALCGYTDARICKVYTFVNILTLAGSLIFYVIAGILAGEVGIGPLLCAAFFFTLGWFRIYGRGDGYVLAVLMLIVGYLCEDDLMAMLTTVLVGCGLFILYSLVDFLRRRKKEKVSFFKEKRPFLPSILAGAAVCLMVIP